MIETNGRKLIAVRVPKEALKQEIIKSKGWFLLDHYSDLKKPIATLLWVDPNFELTYVGTITNGSPLVWSFDPEMYVGSSTDEYGKDIGYDYQTKEWAYITNEESFLSLLSREGYYSENPRGEKPHTMSEGTDGEEYANLTFNHDIKLWHESQSKVFEQIIIIEVK